MTAELNEQLMFTGCTSPLPLKCPICKHGNGGIGLDYCYLRHLIKTETKAAVAEAEAVAHATGKLNMELAVEAEREKYAKEKNIMHNQLTNLRGTGPTLRPNNLDKDAWDHGWDTGVAEATIRKGVKP